MQEYRNLQERTNEDLVIEYQTTHNEDLFRALLEKNTGLLHIIVMDYRIPKYEIEDLLSESYIALIKAVDNFDPTRGVTFTTALKVFVRQHLNRLYNEVTCQKRYNGMDPASYEELVEIHKDDVRGLDCDRFSQIEVDEYLEGLEAKDRYMVTLLLMGYSLSDCASHKADEERIKSLEAKILKGGSDEERAVKAIAEAKEYLEIVAGSRVRDNSKCLVF